MNDKISVFDIKFVCPHCSQSLIVDKDMSGTQVNCPTCGEYLIIRSNVSNQEITLPLASPPPILTPPPLPSRPLWIVRILCAGLDWLKTWTVKIVKRYWTWLKTNNTHLNKEGHWEQTGWTRQETTWWGHTIWADEWQPSYKWIQHYHNQYSPLAKCFGSMGVLALVVLFASIPLGAYIHYSKPPSQRPEIYPTKSIEDEERQWNKNYPTVPYVDWRTNQFAYDDNLKRAKGRLTVTVSNLVQNKTPTPILLGQVSIGDFFYFSSDTVKKFKWTKVNMTTISNTVNGIVRSSIDPNIFVNR